MSVELAANVDQFRRFVLTVKAFYHQENPYHHFRHAVDVVQSLAYMLLKMEWARYFDAADVFTLLVSALCHDIGHPGCNSFYLRNAQTVIAKFYRSAGSPLENYHLMLMFHLIDQNPFLSADLPNFRQMAHESILATDMAIHADFLRRFRAELLSNQVRGCSP